MSYIIDNKSDIPRVIVSGGSVSSQVSDAELSVLKEQARERLADAEQAKAQYEAAKAALESKAEELDGVAKETTSQEILNSIANLDFSTLAKQGTDPDTTLTAVKQTIDQLLTAQNLVIGAMDSFTSSYRQAICEILQIYGYPIDASAPWETIGEVVQTIASKVLAINQQHGLVLSAVPVADETNHDVDLSVVVRYTGASISYTNNTFITSFTTGYSASHPAILCPNLTSLQGMFSGCTALTSIDLRGLDRSKVTTMNNMFGGCTALTSIDLRGLDTSKVTTMNNMFSGCTALTSIDLRGLDMTSLQVMTLFVSVGNNNNSNIEWIDFRGTRVSDAFQSPFNGVWNSFGAYSYFPKLRSLVGDATYEEVVETDEKIWEGVNVNMDLTKDPIGNGRSLLHTVGRATYRAFINGLCDRTGQTALTLTVGATAIALLSAEDIAVATAKNWTIA